MRKLIALLFIYIASVSTSYSQYYVRKNPYYWALSINWNGIQDSGLGSKDAFNIKDTWNYKVFPTQFTFTKNIKKAWNWEVLGTYNHYDSGKIINNRTDQSGIFLSFDAHVAYSFAKHDLRRRKLAKFDPFLVAGLGVTNRKVLSNAITPTVNIGGGFNFYFTRRLGVQVRATGKYGVGKQLWSKELNYMSYSAGIVYRHLPKGLAVKVNNKKRHKWTHKKPRYKKSNKYKVL